MIFFLSTLAYATSVGMFPLKLLPKGTKQSSQQQDVQKYIQSTLIDLAQGKDLEVVTQNKWMKRIEGTNYYNDLLKYCKKSDCIKGASVAGQVPFVVATRFYSYKSINSMTIYLYEIDHPLFVSDESKLPITGTDSGSNSNSSSEEKGTTSGKESRRDKRKRKRRERKQEQQLSTTMNPFSSLGAVRLIEQQSCSAGLKEDLLTNCQGAIMELLDGQLGLVNLLHPFTVRGPEPIVPVYKKNYRMFLMHVTLNYVRILNRLRQPHIELQQKETFKCWSMVSLSWRLNGSLKRIQLKEHYRT